MSIDEILKSGESQIVEFKASLSLQKQALEDLCAMVNADAAKGFVVFGVEDNGSVKGVEEGGLDQAQLTLTQRIRNKFDPPLIVQTEVHERDGRRVVMLSAERRGVAYHEYDGRAWIRLGTEKKQLTVEEKDVLSRSRNRDKHNGPWRCDRCGFAAGIIAFNHQQSSDGLRRDYVHSGCGGEWQPS